MGEESVFPLFVHATFPEPPTGAVDRCLQICWSRRWLQVGFALCPLAFLILFQTRFRQGNRET